MSFFPKTKDRIEEVLDAALDDRIIRAIEDWHAGGHNADDLSTGGAGAGEADAGAAGDQEENLSYQEHLDLQSLEAETERLAAFLAKRYERSVPPDIDGPVADSRVARTLRSYASGVEMYFDEADLSSPAFVFGHMEQMNDLGYLVEDTEAEAESQGWSSEEMPAEFPTIKSYLQYQHELLHQWMYHLSVCENCFDGRRSEPIFPPIDTGKVMDEAGSQSFGSQSVGSRSFGGGSGQGKPRFSESGIFQGDGFGGAYVGDDVSEEEYRSLIQPGSDGVGNRSGSKTAGSAPPCSSPPT